MFDYGKCPILETDVVQKYGLSNDFVEKFCENGCSVECGKFLKEQLEKTGGIAAANAEEGE